MPKSITVLSGPSGAGKSTLVKRVRLLFPELIWSVSATTRPKGPGEVDGVDYVFLTDEEFDLWVTEGRFIEHARYGTNRYGTPHPARPDGHYLIEFDIQGAMELRKSYPSALCIWINPPGANLFDLPGLSDDAALTELQLRLEERDREGPEKIQRRLTEARREFQQLRRDLTLYPVIVNNRDIDRTTGIVASLIAGHIRA